MKYMLLIFMLLCISCISTRPIVTTDGYQQVVVTKICGIDGDDTIVKIKELDRRAQYFMKTRLVVSRFDTLLATPGIDYKYGRWY